MSSEITPNDIRYIESTVHKTITLSNESDGISTVTFISASSPTNATSSEFHYYNAINHLHYRPIAHTQWGNSWIPEMYGIYDHDHYRQSGSSDSSWTRTEFDNFRPQYKNKFHDKGLLLNLSSSRYGNQIKPGTFRLTDTSNGTGARTFHLIDDGFGNLYNPNAQEYQNSETSISSSDNYVGNIFYEQGLVVLTETGSYTSGVSKYYYNGGTAYSMSFDSDVSIKTMEFTCKIPADQYNITSNPTILSSSLGYPSVEQTKWFDYNVQATRSFWNIVDGEIAIPYRDRNFQPYITHIALFNEDDEPLIKTSFPHPIRKPDDQDLVIKVQMDY